MIMQYVTLFVNAVALTLGVLGLISVIAVRDIEKWSKNFLIAFVSVTILHSLLTYSQMISEGVDGVGTWVRVALLLESLCSVSVYNMITHYILHACGKNIKKNAAVYIVGALSLADVALMIVSTFNGCVYIVSSTGEYENGPLNFLVQALSVAILLTDVIMLLIYRKSMPTKRVVLFILCFVFSSFVQLVFFEIVVLYDQVKRYSERKKEMERQKASLLVMQMRPHFIYNVMTDIYYLIPQDADKAQQVTLDFTNYLRGNFTAIAKSETIPFDEELAHVQAYLAVEQVRYEDKLSVTFDTPHTSFRLPPLTLQPIVENAVKYGIDPERDSISVTISSKATEDGSIITVEDTGLGLSNVDNGEPHIALDNVKERLKLFVGGTLTLSPREGGGTIVTVFIPNKTKEN